MINDVSIVIAISNFISMVGNLYWSITLNKVKSNHELVSYWKEESDKKDYQLKEQTRLIHKLQAHIKSCRCEATVA
jgi:hypothetical protein